MTLKTTVSEKKKNLKEYALKVGATIKKFHHIPEIHEHFMFAEVVLDGGELAQWNYPLLKGLLNESVYSDDLPF